MVAQPPQRELNVREVLREIDSRFGDFVSEEWARRSPNLGHKHDFVTAVRRLYRSAHHEEAEESFDALLESKAAEIYERKLLSGRSTAMHLSVPTPPQPRVQPPVPAVLEPFDPNDWTPPPAQGSAILDDLSKKLRTKIELVVDDWMETVNGEPLNVRLLTKAQVDDVIAVRDTSAMVGAEVHREVMLALTEGLSPEESIGDKYTDEQILQIKTRRADEVRAKHELLGGGNGTGA